MVELIAALGTALLALVGALAALVSKHKKAKKTEEKLKSEKEVLKEALEIKEWAHDRLRDDEHRERVRDKYTRGSDNGEST